MSFIVIVLLLPLVDDDILCLSQLLRVCSPFLINALFSVEINTEIKKKFAKNSIRDRKFGRLFEAYVANYSAKKFLRFQFVKDEMPFCVEISPIYTHAASRKY